LDSGHQSHQGRLAGECASEEDVEGAFLDNEVGFVDVDFGAYTLRDVFQFKRHVACQSSTMLWWGHFSR
jgi:hypothetical protein